MAISGDLGPFSETFRDFEAFSSLERYILVLSHMPPGRPPLLDVGLCRCLEGPEGAPRYRSVQGSKHAEKFQETLMIKADLEALKGRVLGTYSCLYVYHYSI